MTPILRKYAGATASSTHVGIPMFKAEAKDFATGSDWTTATRSAMRASSPARFCDRKPAFVAGGAVINPTYSYL